MKYNNNSPIMVISIVILVIAVIVLVVYLIKSKDKLELNLGAKKDKKAKLWILNKSMTYDLRVTVREGDAILYSAPLGPGKMTIPITAVFEDGGNSTVFHTDIDINGTIYPKIFTVLKGHNYSIIIDKDYMNPSGGPKIVMEQT
jgi:hypothetical protein